MTCHRLFLSPSRPPHLLCSLFPPSIHFAFAWGLCERGVRANLGSVGKEKKKKKKSVGSVVVVVRARAITSVSRGEIESRVSLKMFH